MEDNYFDHEEESGIPQAVKLPLQNDIFRNIRTLPLQLPAATWRLDLGAEIRPEGVRFRIWAPRQDSIEVVLEGNHQAIYALHCDPDGYYSGIVPNIGAGTLYRYRVNGGDSYPDPCSRFQPLGPHGPSMVVDHRSYRWSDRHWRGISIKGQVFYELHVGTFTAEGTLDAARAQLGELEELGITAIELMPMAECPGRWNWGYDGVNLYAPNHNYGEYDALKRFIDEAHGRGIGVVLDVVYNHLGPDGCYLQVFSGTYFSDTYGTEWGRAMNFDGPDAPGVREFFIQNACYWVNEFHIDGLRLDATQNIYDRRTPGILAEITQSVRRAAGNRKVICIAENEPQDVRCITPVEKGGYGFDAVWNDDFHHSLRVALTGLREAYFVDYRGTAQELLSAVKRGFLYQGQYYGWQNKGRGNVVEDQPAYAFVVYCQNHDQIANHLHGARLTSLIGERLYRAAMTFLLLSPCTPLLFMGQEFGASAPFVFFADIPSLAGIIYEGRKKYIAQFDSYAGPGHIDKVPDPSLQSTFEGAKLDFSERIKNPRLYLFHKDLLRLRRSDPVVTAQARGSIDGAVLSDHVLLIRYFGKEKGDRLLVLNLGKTFEYYPLPEPLLVAPGGDTWRTVWSSDATRYGGKGSFTCFCKGRLSIPQGTAFFFSSR
jgi:maltooligosyltrehalose trehalohydrolase